MYYHPMALKDANNDGVALAKRLAGELFEGVAEHRKLQVVAMHETLIPVDGSKSALRATAHFIGSVSHRAPSEAYLLNVQPQIMSGDIAPNVTVEMVRRARLAVGEEVLDRARALLDASGIPCSTTVLFGNPSETIVRYVKDRGIDAIVMGTRGMSALKNFLLGSVATKVVGLADVPVTLVKEGPRASRTSSAGTRSRGFPERCGRKVDPFPITAAARGGDALERSRNGLRAA